MFAVMKMKAMGEVNMFVKNSIEEINYTPYLSWRMIPQQFKNVSTVAQSQGLPSIPTKSQVAELEQVYHNLVPMEYWPTFLGHPKINSKPSYDVSNVIQRKNLCWLVENNLMPVILKDPKESQSLDWIAVRGEYVDAKTRRSNDKSFWVARIVKAISWDEFQVIWLVQEQENIFVYDKKWPAIETVEIGAIVVAGLCVHPVANSQIKFELKTSLAYIKTLVNSDNLCLPKLKSAGDFYLKELKSHTQNCLQINEEAQAKLLWEECIRPQMDLI